MRRLRLGREINRTARPGARVIFRTAGRGDVPPRRLPTGSERALATTMRRCRRICTPRRSFGDLRRLPPLSVPLLMAAASARRRSTFAGGWIGCTARKSISTICTRRYYLLAAIGCSPELDAQPARPRVPDIGCGTGRNLALIGQRYPSARLHGVDAAELMLEIATARLRRAGVRATLARGIAEELDPVAPFAHPGSFDHTTISYCLSMVDDPRLRSGARFAILRRAARCTSSTSGTWQDYRVGSAGRWPAWLAKFHVRHRPEVEAILSQLATEHAARGELVEILGRYALLQRLHLPRQSRISHRSMRFSDRPIGLSPPMKRRRPSSRVSANCCATS